MKVTDIFEDYTASDARNEELADIVKQEMWEEFKKRFVFVYDDLDVDFWFDDKLRPELKNPEEDTYLPKKQHEILYRYITKLEKLGPPSNEVKQKITSFINKYGITFSIWADTDEGQQVKDEIEYDLADREAYNKDVYAYHGVSRKDFY